METKVKKRYNFSKKILSLFIIIMFTIYVYINSQKIKYNSCYGDIMMEWIYSTGSLDYDICGDKFEKGLFVSPDKALERLKIDHQEALNYIKENLGSKEKAVSIKNYSKYVDYCKNNIDEFHRYYSDCDFIIAFFEVYQNNFLKK